MTHAALPPFLKSRIEHVKEALGPAFSGRRFLVVGGSLAALNDVVQELRALGAARPLLIASSVGTGPLPDHVDTESCELGITGSNTIEVIRRYEAALRDPPRRVKRAIEQFDPDGRAHAIGFSILGSVPDVLGRPLYGARQASWMRLEDKCEVESFWDEANIEHAPSRIVPVGGALAANARALDQGCGTVWTADASSGLHAGAVCIRWVRSPTAEREAASFFARCSRRVRIMPFLDGVPCSIHGIVCRDGVAVFRPVELLTLRGPGEGEFSFAGAATFWDPPEEDRRAMRDSARRVGEALCREVAYRGGFAIDGVLTSKGFLPTELNPRLAFGLRLLTSQVPELPIGLLALAVQEADAPDLLSSELEELILGVADTYRAAFAGMSVPNVIRSERHRSIVRHSAEWRVARAGEVADGLLAVGPSEVGGFVGFLPTVERPFRGRPLAPHVVRAFKCAERELGVRLGPLEPAVDST